MKSRLIGEISIVLLMTLFIFFLYAFVHSRTLYSDGQEYFQRNKQIIEVNQIHHFIYLSPMEKNYILEEPIWERYVLTQSIRKFKRSLDWFYFFNPSKQRLVEIHTSLETSKNLSDISKFAKVELESSTIGSRWFFFDDRVETSEESLPFNYRLPILSYWNALLSIGFFGWVYCIIMLIFKGFDAEGKMNPKENIHRFLGIGLFFSLWVFCLGKI